MCLIIVDVGMAFLGLFRSALLSNYVKLRRDLLSVDGLINSVASKSEGEINQSLVNKLSSYKAYVGKVGFKGRFFEATIEAETAKSHGRICQMQLPSGKKGTELGDIMVLVDYILDDFVEHKRKIINGSASIIQTKKEKFAKQGLNAAQLYLMTQWPPFQYKGFSGRFDVFPDSFAFYLFVLDPTSPEKEKSSVVSAPMLTRYLGIDKTRLTNSINGKVKFSNPDLLSKQIVGCSLIPLTVGSYLFRALNLALGSPSIEVRRFLREKDFFPLMEEIEDCHLGTQTQKTQMIDDNGKPHDYILSDDEDEYVFAVRLKVILKTIG